MDVSDMSSYIWTDTLVCTYPITDWSVKLDNSIDIWVFFCVWIWDGTNTELEILLAYVILSIDA